MNRTTLLTAALDAPHTIEQHRIELRLSEVQPGANALAQLGDRLLAVLQTANPSEAAHGPEDGPSVAEAYLGWVRYEKARKLTPSQWADMHRRNLEGASFDDLVDALPATGSPRELVARRRAGRP